MHAQENDSKENYKLLNALKDKESRINNKSFKLIKEDWKTLCGKGVNSTTTKLQAHHNKRRNIDETLADGDNVIEKRTKEIPTASFPVLILKNAEDCKSYQTKDSKDFNISTITLKRLGSIMSNELQVMKSKYNSIITRLSYQYIEK